jgi:hypothetical protein
MKNWKDVEEVVVDCLKVLSQHLRAGIAEAGKNKTSARIVGVLGGIRTRHLMNTI